MEAPVTELLIRWRAGHQECLNELMPLVEGELRRIAHRYMRMERQGHTLQTTALVNEAYLKLVDQAKVDWQNRAQFLGLAAHMMRHILVDHARSRLAAKRGAGAPRLSLDPEIALPQKPGVDLVALDDALNKLAAMDPQQSRLIELRYFGGLSIEETAVVMGISARTVDRIWVAARAWLRLEMEKESPK